MLPERRGPAWRNCRRSLRRSLAVLASAAAASVSFAMGTAAASGGDRYRHDGVRIVHDPHAPGMAESYGAPGETDAEGFDPYADTVGPGIYGGKVKVDGEGRVVLGRQYQNHNPRPGPVYAGGGYTAMSEAIHAGPDSVARLLDAAPELLEEISTGGARPLHICGMSKRGQRAAKLLVERGARVDTLDTYGYPPLFRMASNNLPEGARALLEGGADVFFESEAGETAASIAASSHAWDVLKVLEAHAAAVEGK